MDECVDHTDPIVDFFFFFFLKKKVEWKNNKTIQNSITLKNGGRETCQIFCSRERKKIK
jgi:hypothetical protein